LKHFSILGQKAYGNTSLDMQANWAQAFEKSTEQVHCSGSVMRLSEAFLNDQSILMI